MKKHQKGYLLGSNTPTDKIGYTGRCDSSSPSIERQRVLYSDVYDLILSIRGEFDRPVNPAIELERWAKGSTALNEVTLDGRYGKRCSEFRDGLSVYSLALLAARMGNATLNKMSNVREFVAFRPTTSQLHKLMSMIRMQNYFISEGFELRLGCNKNDEDQSSSFDDGRSRAAALGILLGRGLAIRFTGKSQLSFNGQVNKMFANAKEAYTVKKINESVKVKE